MPFGGGRPVRSLECPRREQRVRPQEPVDDEEREGEPSEGEDEGASQLGQAEHAGEALTGADEVGAEHRADRRRPDDDREVTPAVLRQREVGCGIPRLAVGARAAMTRATGMAMSAPPSTWNVVPSPASDSVPERSSASSAPTASPLAMPRPDRICDVMSVRMTLRCKPFRCASSRSGASVCPGIRRDVVT
jgi:hypothetical protein